MEAPTFGQAYDIDEAASRYLADVMASNWVLRRRQPDFFVDYELERRLTGEPTGALAWVQLKGQLKLNTDDTSARLTFETKHLRYYNAAARLPVFVVLVDVTNKRAYYLFVQEWLESERTKIEAQQTLNALVGAVRSGGAVVGNIKGAFPCYVNLFGSRHYVGMQHIDTENCRLTLSPDQDPRYAVTLRLENVKKKEIELVFQLVAPGAEPLGENAGSFEFDCPQTHGPAVGP